LASLKTNVEHIASDILTTENWSTWGRTKLHNKELLGESKEILLNIRCQCIT